MKRKRRRVAPSEGGSNILVDLLTMPVLGVPRLVYWIANKLTEEAEKEFLDEGRVRAELMELQERYDAAEIGEEIYDRQEKALLERLNSIREAKAQQSKQG